MQLLPMASFPDGLISVICGHHEEGGGAFGPRISLG